MNNRCTSLLLIILLSPFLLQCIATQQDAQTLSIRMRTMNNRLMQMEKKLNGIEENSDRNATKNSVEQMQKQQAKLTNTIERLETESLQIKGMMEENTHFFRNIQKENDTFGDSLQSQLAALDSQLAELRGKIDILSKQVASNSERIDRSNKQQAEAATRQALASAKAAAEEAARAARDAAEKAAKLDAQKKAATAAQKKSSESPRKITPDQQKKKARIDTKPAAKKQTAVAKKPQPSGSTGDPLYEKGIALFKSKDYQQAYSSFNEYINKYPKGNMAPNARFWLGDCLFKQNEFELAILEYQKVIADHPNHSKASAALLKQGFAFEKLEDPLTAKIIYEKLLKEYPQSEQKDTAQKRLATLKK